MAKVNSLLAFEAKRIKEKREERAFQ